MEQLRSFLTILVISCLSVSGFSKERTIHVFVALCDNEHQGIVPVPEHLGDGKDPDSNLFWGAGFGVRTFFKNKTSDWKLVKTIPLDDPDILECLLFKHATEDIYLLAEAYDGEEIRRCTKDFLKASNGQANATVSHNGKTLNFGGGSDLVAYVGHDGLMDFDVSVKYKSNDKDIDVMILACFSKNFFSSEIREAGANPLLWTTHLMAPEAYTLKAAIDGWIKNESGAQIEERAAQSYNRYQKCGIHGARGLFTSGY